MKRNKVLKEYTVRGTPSDILAKKYKMSSPTFLKRVKYYMEEVQQQEEFAVIKVHPKWVNGISHLLEGRNIPHEIPEDFELIEKFKSKL